MYSSHPDPYYIMWGQRMSLDRRGYMGDSSNRAGLRETFELRNHSFDGSYPSARSEEWYSQQRRSREEVRITRHERSRSEEGRRITFDTNHNDFQQRIPLQKNWQNSTRTFQRTQSLHRNALQKDVLNNMPSRRKPHFGVNSSGGLMYHANSINDIVKSMEKNKDLMEDSPDGENLRLETLRDIPHCLTDRRSARIKLSESVSRKSKRKPIGFFKRMKYKMGFQWQKMEQKFRNMLFSMELWYSGIRAIESNFGSGVATYFRFLRELFLLNFFITLFMVGFLIVPQILYTTYNANSTDNVTPFEPLDVLTGQGAFQYSILHYGFYSPENVTVFKGHYYSIPNAYFFTMICIYIFMLIILSVRMARSYKINFIETSGTVKNMYSHRIFCGWDFSIANKEAAVLKSRGIYNELKELLSEIENSPKRSLRYKILYIYSLRLLINVVVILAICLTGVLMWTFMMNYDNDYLGVSNPNTLVLPVTVSVIMLAFPIVFGYAVRFEEYGGPRISLYVTLFRTFGLEIVIVALMFVFWVRAVDNCWEMFLGQEVYRLILFDTVISVIGLPLFEYIRRLLHKHVSKKVRYPEFDIARNTMFLVYNQTLLFLGLFYSPLLAFMMTLKMGILYYIRKFTVLHNCKPLSRTWRAAQMQTIFLVLVFLSNLVIITSLVFVILKVPSTQCGPFQKFYYIYEVFTHGIIHLTYESVFFSVTSFFVKQGVVAFILIGMSIGVYYLRAKALAEKGMVNQLRDMLVLQSKDKQFLLKAISKVSEGDWVYHQKPDNFMDASKTWKYMKDMEDVRKPSNVQYKFEVNSPQKRSKFRDEPSTSASSSTEYFFPRATFRKSNERVQIHSSNRY